ncbi:MAG: hypothetical protein ACMXYC_02830 [Candidatus Woesearchaeota archaeon]
MNITVQDLVKALSYEQVEKMLHDVQHGSLHIKRLLQARKNELLTTHKSICATCGCPMHDAQFTLVFGDASLKRKASFCALDCLQSFQKQLETIHKKRLME